MKVYTSKVDWYFALIVLYPIIISIESILAGELTGWLVLAGIVGLILLISKTTRYIISENQLVIKSVWIVNHRIDIAKIRKIEKSNSILSAPALSLDRLLVRFNKFDEVLISPKQKKELLDELLKINPSIEIKL